MSTNGVEKILSQLLIIEYKLLLEKQTEKQTEINDDKIKKLFQITKLKFFQVQTK